MVRLKDGNYLAIYHSRMIEVVVKSNTVYDWCACWVKG